MDQHRLAHFLGGSQQGRNARQVVAIRRAKVGNAHVLKHIARHDDLLQPVFQAAGGLVDRIAAGDFL